MTIVLGLCQGRHEIKDNDGNIVTDFIFGNEVDPLDVKKLDFIANSVIEAAVKNAGVDYEDCGSNPFSNPGDYYDRSDYKYYCEIVIYVTGLSVALIAAVKAALSLCCKVTLMHYNRDAENYYPQEIC